MFSKSVVFALALAMLAATGPASAVLRKPPRSSAKHRNSQHGIAAAYYRFLTAPTYMSCTGFCSRIWGTGWTEINGGSTLTRLCATRDERGSGIVYGNLLTRHYPVRN